MWTLKVPSKLKVFTWRLAQHSIPTNDVLHRQNMSDSHACAICGREDNWGHALLDCTLSRSVWALSNEELVQHMCMNKDEDAKAWLFAMSDTISQKEFSVLITTLWAIWYARRKVIHKGSLQTPFATHAFINRFLADLECMASPPPAARESTPVRPRGWLPPPEDHAKINSDAAVSRSGHFGAVGAICQDEAVIFQGATAVVFESIEDPEVLEVLGIREALALANDLYIQKVAVASDCKAAVEAIGKGTSSEHGAVVLEIKQLSRDFNSCIFSHEFRTSNVEAHKLAKHALTLGTGRHVWLGHPGEISFVPVNVVTG